MNESPPPKRSASVALALAPELPPRSVSPTGTAVRFVVGLGASAGGLEALERFFDKAPIEGDGVYVVVMHLARNFRSVLDELLARHTRMAVKPGADGLELEPNTVYVIQPGTEIEVAGAHLRVNPRPASAMTGRLSSIDVLFRSIASTWGDRGVGVILSGSGTDGSQGVVALHAAGGMTLVQSPESAKFDSMPVAAIATNCVHAVDTPETLAVLAAESAGRPRPAKTAARPGTDEANALRAILASVIGANHLDASQYTQSTFERRVFRRMRERQCGSLVEYAELVHDDRSEARALSEALLIGVTDFFRDDGVFASMARLVMPELVRRAEQENRPVRVWAPGCASGEEAYSLAILLAESTADHPTPVEFQIFATDIHKGLLAEGARGEYPTDRMSSVSEARRREYFIRTSSGMWQVTPRLRKNVVFAPHDVLADPPFTRLDLISCRNLLIYFSVEAQQRVLSSFAFGLSENGFLLLGGSETVGAQREAFEFVDVRRRIFRRTRARTRGAFAVRALEASDRAPSYPPVAGHRRSVKLRETFLQPVYGALLKEFAPASLLVSAERELLHTFGDTRNFLRAPEGVVRLDVSEMCDPALRTPIAAGIDRALRDRTELTFARVELQAFPRPGMIVDVTIRPLQVEDGAPFALVLISEQKTAVAPQPIGAQMDVSSRAAELELEILRTREALQATIEEIEATNEQLKATNEELLSSNEELQSTNEELNSLNEELHSVNAEHFRQNTELTRLTRDFDALLRVSEIGVLFLDEGYNILRFTRLIGELFHFTEADIGRPLRTFRNPFSEFDLEAMLSRVLKRGAPEETEARDDVLRPWMLRAARYPDQKGVVLSVVSVGGVRETSADSFQERARLLANAAPYAGDALFVVDPEDGRVLFANRRAWTVYGVPEAPRETLEISRLTPEWSTESWIGWLSSIKAGASSLRAEVTAIDREGALALVDLRAAILRDDDQPRAVVRVIDNVHRQDNAKALQDLRERAQNLAVSNRELERFASVVAHDLRAPLRHLSQFPEFLAAELGDKASPVAQEHLAVIRSAAGRLSVMVERLLEYARIGVGAPRLGPVDLVACFEEALELLGAEAAGADVKAQFGKAHWVRGDRILVTRLFQNLLQNALKFRKPGAKARIRVQAESDLLNVMVKFDDEGVGVDPSQAEAIFDMFGRGQKSADFAGYGIGLAFCRRICETIGAAISLDATKTNGARFVVRFTRAKGKRTSAKGV